MLRSNEMNLHAMNIMTVMMSESDLMLLMVESSKSQDWPDGLAYVLWEKLLRKFKPSIRNSTMSLTTLVLCFFYLSNILLGS
jgi:hypothetical protein